MTLNILLSFAQFEREIISERTRDKLSAARRKGKWIGGIPVLGYDVAPQGGRLVINKQEAQRVREIFAICEKAGTLAGGLREVNARGLTTKEWHSRRGQSYAGKPFSISHLSRMLMNVLYKGSISNKGVIYPGEHEAIVEPSVWERVNRKLALNGVSQLGRKHLRQQALLLNLARCGQCGAELIPTFTRRSGKRHSYYVCPQARRAVYLAQHQAEFSAIVGESEALSVALEQIRKVIPGDSTVLLLGETGVGKELAAEAIHKQLRPSSMSEMKAAEQSTYRLCRSASERSSPLDGAPL